MNDAIALLAVSQLVCLGGMAYLYMQLQSLRAKGAAPGRQAPPRGRPSERSVQPPPGRAAGQAARAAYGSRAAAATAGRADVAAIAARMSELGIDVPALARRMQKSEEEVRLLLRRQGAAR